MSRISQLFLGIFLYIETCLFSTEDLSSIIYSSHEFSSEEHTFPYVAITGTMPLNPENEESPLEIFFIAYSKESEKNRPITFIFPGGPGSSCGPLTLCSFGPHRLLMPDEGKSLLPPYQIIDNPESLLPWTDLVFIDPIGTGFSTKTSNCDPEILENVLSVEGDFEYLGDFIYTFLNYFNRWNHPKYLAGFSYGTTRCAGIARYLLTHDISLHGMILLGPAIDFSTLVGQYNRYLPNSLLIPTFAATAWYHGLLWPEKKLEDVISYAKEFTFDAYIPSLIRPHRLNEKEETFYQEFAFVTGLPLHAVRRYQARFDEFLYTTELFGSERKVLGGLDTRYIGDLSSIRRKDLSDDPSYKDMQGLHAAFNHYLLNYLNTQDPFTQYIRFNHQSWNFETYDSVEFPDLMQRIRKTLIHNPKMNIFIGSGYYDCRTPFAAAEYCFDHLNLPDTYRKNLHFQYYEAGHGFIFDLKSLQKLKKDIQNFLSLEESMEKMHY